LRQPKGAWADLDRRKTGDSLRASISDCIAAKDSLEWHSGRIRASAAAIWFWPKINDFLRNTEIFFAFEIVHNRLIFFNMLI
jgi:hypothetical protein